jgi:hypothetical protein
MLEFIISGRKYQMNQFMKALFPVIGLVFISMLSTAQISKKSFLIQPAGVSTPANVSADWNPVLLNLEMPEPDGGADELIKERARELADSLYGSVTHEKKSQSNRSISKPIMGNNFYGNPYNNSVPNDNDVAVSNDNKVVSVINSSLRIYDLNLDTAYPAISLFTFFGALGLPNEHFDPKVIYDPQADRFILMCLNGFTDSTSNIAIAFSQTPDPRQNWSLYTITGNPYNDTLWTDYPMISITEQHAYITVNLLKNDESWQTGFVRTIVWQLDKSDAYSGAPLNSILYGNFDFNNRNIRNMCPVRNGNELFSGTMYFLSNRNFTVSSDSIFLISMPDVLNADTSMIDVSLLRASTAYHVPPDAKQTAPRILQTNDARILGAFKHNNRIQFVSNTRDTVLNKAACYHGVIDLMSANPEFPAYIITNDTVEYGYPNIAYAGTNNDDHTAIIGINYTAADIFPACGAISTDAIGNYSDLLTIRKGDNYISVLSGGNQRWGDYSGAQRKYNQNGVVWLALTYGSQSKKPNTWIAELSLQPFSGVADERHTINEQVVYPSPAQQTIFCSFRVQQEASLNFRIVDLNGRFVQDIFNERALPGLNTFSFNTASLQNGNYILVITNEYGSPIIANPFTIQK